MKKTKISNKTELDKLQSFYEFDVMIFDWTKDNAPRMLAMPNW